VRNVRNVGGDGNGWRENSKFDETKIEGFSKREVICPPTFFILPPTCTSK
jgi:hypothetical protein